jgi:hypothetical protein
VTDPDRQRASRLSGAEEAAVEAEEDLTALLDPRVLPEERDRSTTSYGLSRMQTEWPPDEALVMAEAREMAQDRVLALFLDAFEIREDIWAIVREEVSDPETGEALCDSRGQVVYQRRATGGYVENYGKLTSSEKENFLMCIAVGMVEWEQVAADLYGEAMLAKVVATHKYAQSYREPVPGVKGTIEDRDAEGKMGSAEKRYHAIFLAWLSKKADGMVSSMRGLENALKITIKN